MMDQLLFGLDVSTAAAPGADPVAVARVAEDLGFDFVSANDHPGAHDPRYETWTMLAWIAAATSRIQLATRVLGLPYRHPAVLAKMAESFDRLSGGRLILGLGAGAFDAEFHAFGLGVRPPREKLEALEEAVRIIRGLWSADDFTFIGRHYRTDRAALAPRPARRIPIWLGTFGNRGLAITGQLADGWIPSLELAPPEQAVVMRDRILAAARAAGRQPQEITCAYNLVVRVDHTASAHPTVVSGPPDAVAERLLDFVKLGFTAMNFIPAGPGKAEQRERLAREVIPAVRAGA
jgi:probable F420-dependent oxidoreductase